MRGVIIQNRTTVTLPGDPVKRATTEEALRIWDEYGLFSQGITYDQLGYRNYAGELSARKIDEHRLCDRFVSQAQKDKPAPKPKPSAR